MNKNKIVHTRKNEKIGILDQNGVEVKEGDAIMYKLANGKREKCTVIYFPPGFTLIRQKNKWLDPIDVYQWNDQRIGFPNSRILIMPESKKHRWLWPKNQK
jgi:hypothetical protein